MRHIWQKLRTRKLRLKKWLYKHVALYRKTYIHSPLWRRASYAAVAVVFIGGAVVFENLGPFFRNNTYELTAQTKQLIGEVRDDTPKHLKSNQTQTAYEFTVPETSEGASEHTGRVDDAYSASFSVNPKEGISVTEKTSQVSVRLIPRFYTGQGKLVEDRIVYPFGSNQLIYSLKYNGLKEDIIVPQYLADELDYDFELVLPVGAEARLDDNGDIGIYTADSVLFGNVTYGSDEDRERVEKARDNSEKTNLIMTIPAPIIKDAANQEYTDRSKFELSDKTTRQETVNAGSEVPDEVKQQLESKSTFNVYNLTIASERLKELSYPIAIDPTIQVPHANSFYGVETDAGATIDTANSMITRGEVTGGTVGSWANNPTSLPINMLGFATVVSNGYIYILGGDRNGTIVATVNYAPINPNGTIGSWSTTTSLSAARRFLAATVHNGYVYISGGNNGSTPYFNAIEYAKINPNGTLGSWTATATIPTARRQNAMTSANGYLYVAGGLISGGIVDNYVGYARLNANGSIASDSGCGNAWCSGPVLPANRSNLGLVSYNGWLYAVGGASSTLVWDTVYVSRIGSDGSVGAWDTTSSMTTARSRIGVEIWNGYMYAINGCLGYTSSICNGWSDIVEYAPIHANGSLGAWRQTTDTLNATEYLGSAVYNGRLYALGGCLGGNCSPYTNRVEYATISSAGSLADGNWSSATNLPAAYSFGESIVYNGCLYHVGGWSGGVGLLDVVRYATINANGSLSAWTTSGNTLSSGRQDHVVTIYNGRLYVAGGNNGASVNIIEYATINANCSIGSFSTTTSNMPAARRNFGFAIHNDIAYMLGGIPAIDQLYRASVNASTGDIAGSWSSNFLDGNKMYHRLFIHNGFMYAVGGGGSNCTTELQAAVMYAPINADGSVPLGNWTTGTSYVHPRCYHSAFLYNGYLYMAGGHGGGNAATTIEKAPINADGSVGTWQAAGDTDQARGHPNTNYGFGGAAAHNGYVYLAGGYHGSGHLNSVVYKALNNGGQGAPDTFAAGTTFNQGGTTHVRKSHAAVAYNGYLYVLGGCSTATVCTTAVNTIRYAPINDNGSVGTWASTTNTFSTVRRDHYAFAYNGRMYVMGGRNAAGTMQTDMQYATIQSNGNINTAWTTDGTALPAAGLGPGMVLNDNVVYMLGGASSETTTRYAVIDPSTGDVGAWSTSTALPEGRSQLWAAVYKGYIYAIGGNSSGGRLRSVYYAPLNSDNTIGTWSRASTEINDALNSGSLTATSVLNGYLYIIGGENSGGFYNRTQYAAIGVNGDLGAWQLGPASGLAAHGNMASADWRGVLYQTGGQITGTNPTNTIRYASLQSIPRIGNVWRGYDFEVGVKPDKLITRGLKQTGAVIGLTYANNVSCNNTLYGNNQAVANAGFDGVEAVTIDLGTPTLVRCLLVNYTLDDQQAAVFPDTGSQTHITDFDLYYTANPGSRLRGGRTFTNGYNRGLDASPPTILREVFTSTGNFSVPAGVSEVDVVLVGGGGGGGHAGGGGGGGGAGRVTYATGVPVTPGGTVAVTIGNGGAGRSTTGRGGAGDTTSFGSVLAQGGTGGAGGSSTAALTGDGSGGGGSYAAPSGGGAGQALSNAGGDGFDAPSGTNAQDASGGGGGAGSAGGNAVNVGGPGGTTTAGAGGAGVNLSTLTGHNMSNIGMGGWVAGGGGGGLRQTGGGTILIRGLGGGGGGGHGGAPGEDAVAGAANTGSGGGGAYGNAGTPTDSAAGGSGLAVVMYREPVASSTSAPQADFAWQPRAGTYSTVTFVSARQKDLVFGSTAGLPITLSLPLQVRSVIDQLPNHRRTLGWPAKLEVTYLG